MNYLAHLALAQPCTPSYVGNLLGDFSKGVCLQSLTPAIAAGLANHRAVDRFTDTDLAVRAAKQQFSVSRRRFAGVALDVLFDHFLIKHWSAYYTADFAQAKVMLYHYLARAEPMMPPMMQQTMYKVRTQDWFAAYQQLEHLGMALDSIASRVRFTNQFSGIITEIAPRYAELEQLFLDFYPRLHAHIQYLAIETTPT